MNFSESINNYFGIENIEILDKADNLFRCVKRNIQEPYEICYIDKSTYWTEDNYLKYIENKIATNYYEHPGYLQWNYYYYFISPENTIEENKEQKKIVEENGIYARKYIMSEAEFINWLNDYNSLKIGENGKINTDLYSQWIESLRKSKLYFVYDRDYTDFQPSVDKYLINGDFIDTEKISKNVGSSSVDVLDKITKIKLTEFREYPKSEAGGYNFGTVNLIHGPNASGKTSLFDALELTITGKFSKGSAIKKFKIELETNNNTKWKYPESSSSIYRNRDANWYMTGQARVNRLNLNFNKFNFYNCNYAYELKSKSENILDVITEIALGKEVNWLESRIIGFRDRFRDEYNYYLKQFDKLNIDLTEKNNFLRLITETSDNSKEFKKNLIKQLNEKKWKFTNDNDDEQFLININNILQLVINCYTNITKKLPLDSFDIAKIRTEVSELKNKQSNFHTAKNKIDELNNEIGIKKEEASKLEKLQIVINELHKYIQNINIPLLIGLKDVIDSDMAALRSCELIQEQIQNYKISGLFEDEKTKSSTLKVIEDSYINIQNTTSQNINRVQSSISNIEENLDSLSKITSDIKSLGKEYIAINPESENCPLCNTKFEREKLLEAIESTIENFSKSQTLLSLKQEIIQLNNDLNNINSKLVIIQAIKNVSFLLFGDNSMNVTYTEILQELDENAKNIISLTKSLNQNRLLQSQFEADQLSETKFGELQSKLKQFNDFEVLDRDKLVLIENALKSDISLISNTIDISEKLLQEKRKALIPFTDEDEVNLRIYQEVDIDYSQLAQYIDFNNNINFLNLQESITIIKSAIEIFSNEFHKSIAQNQTSIMIDSDIKKMKTDLHTFEFKRERAKFAMDFLENLLIKYNKLSSLESYIGENRNELVKIFKLIHTPKEFKDIIFDNDKILLKTYSDESRSLDEISSGQRTALALSIFLSLNGKLKKGPNVIFFDDPVTYVDDLNILSFFDFLRELSLQTKRQIFFATANNDVAFLFRKKFEFLKSDFVTIPLEREIV